MIYNRDLSYTQHAEAGTLFMFLRFPDNLGSPLASYLDAITWMRLHREELNLIHFVEPYK